MSSLFLVVVVRFKSLICGVDDALSARTVDRLLGEQRGVLVHEWWRLCVWTVSDLKDGLNTTCCACPPHHVVQISIRDTSLVSIAAALHANEACSSTQPLSLSD